MGVGVCVCGGRGVIILDITDFELGTILFFFFFLLKTLLFSRRGELDVQLLYG